MISQKTVKKSAATLALICTLILTSCGNTSTDSSASLNNATKMSGKRTLNTPGTNGILQMIQEDDSANYKAAEKAGMEFKPTSDGNSIYGIWTPDNFNPETDGFIVALHGHDGYVSAGFEAWEPFLEEHHYGYLGLQWWFGGGETMLDYYSPEEMYALIQTALQEEGIPGGRILLEGFSRGSSNIYALEAIDNASNAPLFLMTIANAGSAAMDYPPTKAVDEGMYGEEPFENTHWAIYCGDKDKDVGGGCDPMKDTKNWIESKGGTIDLFIEDPNGDHGGFHKHSENAEAAFAVYEKLLAE